MTYRQLIVFVIYILHLHVHAAELNGPYNNNNNKLNIPSEINHRTLDNEHSVSTVNQNARFLAHPFSAYDDNKRSNSNTDQSPGIRRFPQYPSNPQPYSNSDAFLQRQPQVISVLSGSASPHQSVSWNPPPTINPPVPPASRPQALRFFPSIDAPGYPASNSAIINYPSSPTPIPYRQDSPKSDISTSNNARQVLNSNNNSNNNATPSGKKDDVLIYYYYYYDDDDKNGTRVTTVAKGPDTTTLDTIPSLEQYDNMPDQKSKELKNKNNHQEEAVASFRGFVNHFDQTRSTTPSLAFKATTANALSSFYPSTFTGSQNQPQDQYRSFVSVTPSSAKQRSSTDVSISVSVSGDGYGAPVSNVFRYGSSVGPRPTFDSVRVGQFSNVGSQRNSFQPQFPGQGFRHIPSSSTPSSFTFTTPELRAQFLPTNPENYLGSRSGDQEDPHAGRIVNGITSDTHEAKSNAIEASNLPATTLSTTTSTASTTTITTTTTTTPTSTTIFVTEETTTADSRRNRFGSRRNRFGSNRINPLTRHRPTSSPSSLSSTTTTTTTTTSRPRARTYGSLRRPSSSFRSYGRKPDENKENEAKEEISVNHYSTSSISLSTSTPKRFGASSRNRYGSTTRPSVTRSSTSTTSAPSTSRAPLRRPNANINNRYRGRQRPSFFRSRHNKAESEESTEAPKETVSSEASVTVIELNVNNNKDISSLKPEETLSSSSTETSISSTTEKIINNRNKRPRNPLFRNRPRSNLFGSRRTNADQN